MLVASDNWQWLDHVHLFRLQFIMDTAPLGVVVTHAPIFLFCQSQLPPQPPSASCPGISATCINTLSKYDEHQLPPSLLINVTASNGECRQTVSRNAPFPRWSRSTLLQTSYLVVWVTQDHYLNEKVQALDMVATVGESSVGSDDNDEWMNDSDKPMSISSDQVDVYVSQTSTFMFISRNIRMTKSMCISRISSNQELSCASLPIVIYWSKDNLSSTPSRPLSLCSLFTPGIQSLACLG